MTAEKDLQAAINKKCLECCCGSHNEVRDCRLKGCALHAYRPFQRAVQPSTRRAQGRQVSVFDVIEAAI